MSKIARNPVPVPDGVTVTVAGQEVKAKGPKGELSLKVHQDVSIALVDEGGKKQVKLQPRSQSRVARMNWGTSWSLIRNILKGVKDGYTRILDIEGVGYRANVQGKNLVLQLGYSHDVIYPIPAGIQITAEKQTRVTITGIDSQRVGQVAAEIRAFRGPEPYKGKGVRYEGEHIVRKEGKKK
jgi:large subunit ribosomal protein L6